MAETKFTERNSNKRELIKPEIINVSADLLDELKNAAKDKKAPKPHKKNKKTASDSGKNKSNDNEVNSINNTSTNDNRIRAFDLSKWLLKKHRYGLNNDVLHVMDKWIYEPMTLDRFDRAIRQGIHKGELPAEAEKCINRYYLTELLAWISSSPTIPELPELPNRRYIALADGLFDLKQGQYVNDADLLNDFPILYNRLPVKYLTDYTASDWEHSNSLAFLRRFANPDCKEECVNHCKYLFGKTGSNNRNGKIMTHFYGPADSGKSVCSDIIEGMLGKTNYSNMGLSSLSKNFAVFNLYHKLANISSDESLSAWTMEAATNIKLITSGDMVTADVKFQKPVQFRPYTSLICFGNDVPVISRQIDAGGAITRRLNLIPTGPTVKDKIEHYFELYLEEELDLLFSVSIDYFRTHEMPAKIVPLEEFDDLEISKSALFELWTEECTFEANDDDVLRTGDSIWPCYENYVRNAPYTSRMTKKQFEMAMATRFAKKKCPQKVDGGSAYFGIALKYGVYNPKKIHHDDNEDEFRGW